MPPSPSNANSRTQVHRFAVIFAAPPEDAPKERVRYASQRRSTKRWSTRPPGALHRVPRTGDHNMRPDLVNVQPACRIRPHHPLDQLQQFRMVVQFNLLEVVLSKLVPCFTPARTQKPSISSVHRFKSQSQIIVTTRENGNSLSRHHNIRCSLEDGHP